MNPANVPYGWLVKRVAHRLEQNMSNFLKPYNITIMQSWVLMLLKRTEKCYTFKELEKQFGVSQPTMAGTLARLDQKNVIITSQDEKDKRTKKVEISDEDRVLINRLGRHSGDSERAIVGDFTKDEQETSHLLLERAYYNAVGRDDESD